MERIIALAAAAAIALAATPALAKSKKASPRLSRLLRAALCRAPYPGAPFVSRNVSDPSFGNRAGINYARRTGRCVVDLGYGRYEYCGW